MTQEFFCLELPPDPALSPPGIGHLRSPIIADILSRSATLLNQEIKGNFLWDSLGVPVARHQDSSGKNGVDIASETIVTWKNYRDRLNLLATKTDDLRSDNKMLRVETTSLLNFLCAHDLIEIKTSPTWFSPKSNTWLTRNEAKRSKCPITGDPHIELRWLQHAYLKTSQLSLPSSFKQFNWPHSIKQKMTSCHQLRNGYTFSFIIENNQLPSIAIFLQQGERVHKNRSILLGIDHELIPHIKKLNADDWPSIEKKLLTRSATPIDSGIKAVCPINGTLIPVKIYSHVDLPGSFGLSAVLKQDCSSAVIHINDNAAEQRSRLGAIRISGVRSWGIELPPSIREQIPDSSNQKVLPLFALSWYFAKGIKAKEETLLDQGEVLDTKPSNIVVGAVDHAIIPLLYARVLANILADLGASNLREPFPSILSHGVVRGEDGRKMSRLHNNVIDAQKTLATHKSDIVRLAMAMMGPTEADINWSPSVLKFVSRFLARIKKDCQQQPVIINSCPATSSHIELIHDLTNNGRLHIAVTKLIEFQKSALLTQGASPIKVKEQRQLFLRSLWPFAPVFSESMQQLLDIE